MITTCQHHADCTQPEDHDWRESVQKHLSALLRAFTPNPSEYRSRPARPSSLEHAAGQKLCTCTCAGTECRQKCTPHPVGIAGFSFRPCRANSASITAGIARMSSGGVSSGEEGQAVGRLRARPRALQARRTPAWSSVVLDLHQNPRELWFCFSV